MKTLLVIMMALTSLPAAGWGAQPAISWDGSHAVYFSDDDGPYILGFRFRVETDIAVTALGAFDYQTDGLVSTHSIAIWLASGGDPIVAAMIPAGTDAALAGQFRYVPVPATRLQPAVEYVIAASGFFGSTNDLYAYDAQGWSNAAAVTYLEEEEAEEAASLTFPDSPREALAVFGANFQFVEVPQLTIRRLEPPSQVQLSWPTNATGYQLEYADRLPALAWNEVTNPSSISGSKFVVTSTTTNEQRYYRLRKP